MVYEAYLYSINKAWQNTKLVFNYECTGICRRYFITMKSNSSLPVTDNEAMWRPAAHHEAVCGAYHQRGP